MEIATNAVLAAVLIQASDFSRCLDLPLETPLQASNVVTFRVGMSWNQADSDLNGYLAYKGGFEFRFAHGVIDSFNTRNSYIRLQRPGDSALLRGDVRYDEAACWGKAREVFRNLGYTNISLLNDTPEINGPIPVRGGVVPRYVFRWPAPGEAWFSEARIEVNAEKGTIE